ncbi:MAG: hypothetical protein DLM73_14530 [Chthoniobacterales bacterium]|nr:MAG: hypothetical protein DLM73_14530 [Chthoniobacterales bacterium]
MQILFVTPYYYPELEFGGPPKRLHALARKLASRGHNVRVATFDSRKPARRDSAVIDTITVQYIPWVGLRSRQIPTRMARLDCEVRGADLVHCYGLYNLLCPLAAALSRRASVPFILEPMGMFVPRSRSLLAKRMYNSTLTKSMAKHAAALVATSPLEAAELKELTPDDVVVRRNGIDFEEFADLPDGQPMRQRWGVEVHETLVVYFGRISSKKNLHDLIAAFIKADVSRSKLVMAGPVSEPNYRHKLQAQIDTAGQGKNIRLQGPLYGQELKAAWAAADLFVLPSLNENFGNAAGEAVAAGVPVLLTETCGIAPIIHQRAGLAVPLGVEPLAEGLRLMLNPEVREQMTARREEVKRELSWDEPVRQTERLYGQIIRGGRPQR